tara:strand:+ start:576 stop:926 length:351 start_codon:yes stop_codon:yes gene_type:complete
MNDIHVPLLTEPGVTYFLRETLKQCRDKKYKYYNRAMNIGLLFLFLMLLGIILIYKKKTKPSKEDLKKKRIEQQQYILHKIKEIQQQRKREHNEIITHLPTFESNFETMHKNYYKI